MDVAAGAAMETGAARATTTGGAATAVVPTDTSAGGAAETMGAPGMEAVSDAVDAVTDSPSDAAEGDATTSSAATVDGVAVVGK